MPRFGPAGNSDSFKEMGYRNNTHIPEYLKKMGLTAYEYQAGRGVRIGEENAVKLGEGLKEVNVQVSLHAPYYISLSGVKEKTRMNSLNYILDSAKAVDWMGGNRIIVHSGSASQISREEALVLAKNTLTHAQKLLDDEGLGHIHICPETMGKLNQLGNLKEVVELCKVDERFIPCIDFGHLNARTYGGINNREDYIKILDLIHNELGEFRGKNFHTHFSKIEYTEPGGELRHLTFDDTVYGPEFEPLGRLCVERDLTPVFICESAGTQAEDAIFMRDYYNKLKTKESR